MIKLTQLINELGINKPGQINLIPGKKYLIFFDKEWDVYEYIKTRGMDSAIFRNNKSELTTYLDNLILGKTIKPYKEEVNELEINKPSEFNKFKPGGRYLVTYDLGDEEIYKFGLKIIKIDLDGCCTAMHIDRENDEDENDFEDLGFTLCKEDVIKVEPYVVNELNINNPNITAEEVIDFWDSNIFLNQDYRDLKKKYCLKYSINSSSDTETLIQILPQHALNQFYRDIKELHRRQQQNLRPPHYGDLDELQINKPSLFNRLKNYRSYLISWNNNGTIETEKIKVLGLDGDLDQTPWIQLFPEDLISLKPLND